MVSAARVLRMLRSARARAPAGDTSPARTSRRAGRGGVNTAWSPTFILPAGPPALQRRHQRPSRSCEPVAPFAIVAEHVLACAGGREDDVPAPCRLDE